MRAQARLATLRSGSALAKSHLPPLYAPRCARTYGWACCEDGVCGNRRLSARPHFLTTSLSFVNNFMLQTTLVSSLKGLQTVFKPRLLTSILSVACLSGTIAHAGTLGVELQYLIEDHPQIQAAAKTLESRRLDVNRAEAKNLPTISLSATGGPSVVDSPAERAKRDGNVWQRTALTAGVTVTQPVFDGFATTTEIRISEVTRELASMSLENTRQNTMFEGVKAYIDVLRQLRLVGMSRENERTIQRQLNLEDERVRRGSGVEVDVLQAKSRLQISKERRVGYEGALLNAVSRFTQVFGRAPDLETMIDPSPPPQIIPSSMERARDIALIENPALANAAGTMEVAGQRRGLATAELLPSLNVVGRANIEKHNNATNGIRRDYSVLLEANWDIFSGFTTPATITQSQFDYRAAQDNHDHTARKVIEQTELAWQSLVTARERKRLLGNAVNIASEVFTSRKKLRDAGKETVINVLDAESEVNNAQINYTSASYDERVAVYQLLLSMGRLSPTYIDVASR